jgi:glycosyltransferase involved in cell wall biosynthesis
MTVLEGFASRTPIVASRIGSLAEIIRDGANGLLFTTGDSLDLAKTVKAAWNNPELLRNLSINGRTDYEENYAPESNFRQLMDIYRAAQDEFEGARASERLG